jgi:hypothetical protein
VTDGQTLASTVARHDALNPWCSFVVGAPEGDGWVAVSDLIADDTVIAGWIGDLRTRVTQGRGDVAGSYLSSWLGGLLVGSLAAVVVAEGSGWSLAPEGLAIRRHPDGWFDGCAVRPQALRQFDADEVVALLTPLFSRVRRHAAFGRAGMWGAVADAIADRAVRRAEHEGGDVDQAWAGAMDLIDAIAARQPLLRSRPRLEGRTVVASTCCLYFKISGDDGYCSTCPRRCS